MGISGGATIGDTTAPLDLSFGDIFSNLEVVFTLHFEARKDKWTFFSELQYVDMSPEATVSMVPVAINADIDFKNTMIELGGGDNWSHAFVGTRFFGKMSDTWTFIARTDAGYGGSDNKAFNAAAMFDYRFKNWGSVFFGYRYLNYDYDYDNDNDNDKAEDTYAFNAYQSGPLAGLTFHW